MISRDISLTENEVEGLEEILGIEELDDNVTIFRDRPGIYRVNLDGRTKAFLKRSNEHWRSYTFETEEQADKLLELYEELLGKEFFHPSTSFFVEQSSNGEYYISMVVPQLKQIADSDIVPGFIRKNYYRTRQRALTMLGHRKHHDISIMSNYGTDDNDNVYYFDIEILNRASLSHSTKCNEETVPNVA